MGTKAMEEVEVVMKRFGDEQSTLLDRFERLSFEVKLNEAILGRSLSEPRYQVPALPLQLPRPLESKVTDQGHRHHRRLGFQKVWKKLFKPIFGSRKEGGKESIPDEKINFKFMKAFSRSVRV
ncbi:hypothetical protein Ccrd_010372 [Cynara cardunculus var. scolymus]|uniref:Uncharacterized protein n=1 Tax=Cynara cardunculus var. scolymus TaxID=59895 RepID=A0A118K6U5_CYNCS|nr:hypothetical protein Ccrd_010372 [Cynara cardunculus var. scolymus]